MPLLFSIGIQGALEEVATASWMTSTSCANLQE